MIYNLCFEKKLKDLKLNLLRSKFRSAPCPVQPGGAGGKIVSAEGHVGIKTGFTPPPPPPHA
jgi:hypothetical protein